MHYICLIKDITERKRYEYALLESKLKYHSYIANAPYGIFIVNSEGYYKEVNNFACKMTGYSESELLNMNIKDILNPKYKHKALNNFKTLIKNGRMNSISECITKKGKKIQLSIDAVRIHENQYVAFCQNITENLKTVKLLKESEEKFRNLMEQSPMAIQIMNPDGKISQVNTSFMNL